MKNYALIIVIALFISSCGGEKKADGIALANEVCECNKKLHGLSNSDPEAQKIRLECAKILGENLGKVNKNKEQEDAFTNRVNECTAERMRNMSN